MEYNVTINTTDKEKQFINHILQDEPKCADDCFGEDETFTKTAVFPDGIEIDVKLCGVQYEEWSNNLPWAEAVLFENGSEIMCTEPEDDYFGEWVFEYEGNTYIVKVI